jgi:hypothetical protein
VENVTVLHQMAVLHPKLPRFPQILTNPPEVRV